MKLRLVLKMLLIETIFELKVTMNEVIMKNLVLGIFADGAVVWWIRCWIPTPGSRVQNHWVARRSTQAFILPRSIK